jgi:PhzF family phenazine biosynthesis protein
MAIPLYQIDAFSSQPFRGNPAGVCLLETSKPDQWMQAVASEMNLSETAFLLPEQDGYRLRWFTPAVEVDLCGHATLASAHVLFEIEKLASQAEAHFYSRSGLLTARRKDGWIELNFPSKPAETCELPAGLLEALNLPHFTTVVRNQFDYLVEVEHEDDVNTMHPDFGALKAVQTRGVIVTARSKGTEYDFVSRFFAPAVGVNEDPVTGSAHCCLAPYWAQKLGKTSFTAYQSSARGGMLRVKLEGERVVLSGQAVTVFRADLLA